MLKLFRSIRKKLLSENKTNQYLKYAIGEIFLVVIGILIALQINNWNQNRLVTNQEHKLLLELKTDLKITQEELSLDIFYGDSVYNLAENLLTYLDTITQTNYDKDVYSSKFMIAMGNVKLYPRTIAFENLKSLGIEIVKNDSIRNLILDIYDRRLPRITFWENEVTARENEIKNMMASHFQLKKDNTMFVDDYYYLIPYAIEPKSITEFKNRIGLLQGDRKSTNGLYQELDARISHLIELLDLEYIKT
ncbi:MAG: hypothetical protein BM563_02180 [Bacteroidetes bacterium MedPE-SWsnd-G1]|nr:MAG: hypothetical protein BM563_02180 [Bacteroidetes bacterium MedPE-SWsnd-G1]